MMFYMLHLFMHKMVPYFLTAALHSAARQVRLQTVLQEPYSPVLAGPLSCKHSAMCLCIQVVSLN